jgi:hypothetical protein
MTNNSKQSVVTMAIIIAMFVSAFMPVSYREGAMKDVLYSSIVWVESKGDVNARSSDGSVGIIQIKPVMVTEVNRICKIRKMDRRYTLSDRRDPDKSKEMFWIYQEFYHPNLDWDSVSVKQMESMARKWNGGPKGEKKRGTRKYWKKVSNRLALEIRNKDIADLL